MTMTLAEILGWVGSLLTLAVYAMTTMLPLRAVALVSNFFFIGFAYLSEIWPTLVLNLLLLPLNATRLFGIVRTLRRVKRARRGDFEPALDWLDKYESGRRFAAGETLFEAGDPSTSLCYVRQGNVRFPETGKVAKSGELFGEVAFFTSQRVRTASAICETDCEIIEIDEETFVKLYYQSPAFGMYVTRLIASRLADTSVAATAETQ